MGMRKMVLKVNIACKKCQDKLLRSIHDVPGVKKVEIDNHCCPHFTIIGDFNVEEILRITEKKRKCITVVSVEELPPPPKPDPPKPAPDPPKPDPPKPEPPKPDPPKPDKPKPDLPCIVEPDKQICVVTTDCKGWPKLPKNFPHIPPGTSLIIMVENLVLCPHNKQHDDCEKCDSCC